MSKTIEKTNKIDETKSLETKIESVSLKSKDTSKNDKQPINKNEKLQQEPSKTGETSKSSAAQIENNNKKGKHKRKRPIRQQPKDDPLKVYVNQALQTCTHGEEMKALCDVLQPNANLLQQAYDCIRQDLLNVLYERFPKCNIDVNAFGSTLNGLAFKDSDFDIYVQIEPKNKQISKIIYTVIAGMQRKQTFEKIFPIINAKIPIIKCIHTYTRYSCDISFSNAIGVYNSRIMRQLLVFDYRIYPLSVILKYWMRTHELSGTGRITNYCLMHLIIYYLQTIKPPILPPLNDFQKDIEPVEVDYWNLAFDMAVQTYYRNQMLVSDLLQGFFEFYSNFNFATSIISTLYGTLYDRNKFKMSIPNEFWRYQNYLALADKNSPTFNLSSKMCVQDPFNLSVNIAACVTAAHLELFQRELRYAGELCQKSLKKNNNEQLHPSNLLLKLFNEFAPFPIGGCTSSSSSSNDAQCITSNYNSLKSDFECKLQPIEFELALIRTMLMNIRSNNTSTSVDSVIEPIHVQKVWSEKMVEFIECIFRRLFLCEIKQIQLNDERVAKYPKMDGDKDICSTVLVKQFSITCKYDVYSDRKALKPNSATYLYEHEELSKRNFELKKNPIELNAIVNISIGDGMKFVVINVSDLVTKKTTTGAKKDKKKIAPLKKMFNNFVQSIRNHLRAYFIQYRDEYIKSMKA